MKTYRNLYDEMLDINNIITAIEKASENKLKRRDVREVLADKVKYANIIQGMLREHSYQQPKYKTYTIVEGSKKKKRQIEKPHFKYDQLIQNVLITQLKKIILHSLYEHAHGSLDNRGPYQSAQVISKWIRKDKKGTKYCLQMDLHHCYPSVDQEVLIRMYHRIIKDDDFNIENDKVIRATDEGLAIGAPTSFWHLHFLLTPFDHWIVTQDGVEHYLRHADDIIVFGSNKKKLHKVERDAMEYIRENLHMEVNHSHQVFPLEWKDKKGKKHGRPLDVCGYLFYKDRTILREARMLGITRKAARIGKKEKPTVKDARQMTSQMGWLNHSDTYNMYLEKVKPSVSKRCMRKIISKHQRRENERRRQCSTKQSRATRRSDRQR